MMSKKGVVLMLEIKITEDLTARKIQWYDLIECSCKDNEKVFILYLPAALLKVKGILDNIDLGNEKQYCLDFNNFIKYGKNIDMLFDDYLKDNKYPIYREIFAFCRHLYRRQGLLRNDYYKPIDQAEEQFIREFKKFVSELNCEEFINKKQYKIEYLNYIRDLLKIFILFKSSKITNIEYPLDTFRDYLPDDAKIIELEKMLSLTKDTGSVAPLYRRVGSRNEIYIKKLYALMLTNLDISNEELLLIFGYINYLEEASNSLLYKDLTHSLENIKDNLLINIQSDINTAFFDKIVQRLVEIIGYKGDNLVNYFIDNKIKLSLCGYFILKIYIENKLKILNWNKIAREKSKSLQIIYKDKAYLQKVYDITKKVPINNCDEMLSALNNANSLLTSEEQRIVLNTIFPNDTRRKDKKRELLKNNFDKITIIYAYYVLKRGISGQLVDFNHFYNLVIAAYLYFQLSKLDIKEIKFINCNENNIDDRRKNIASLYYQLTKSMFTKKQINISYVDFAYLEISSKIFSKYYFLFDLNITHNEILFDKFIEVINELVYNFWQEGLYVALRVAKV